MLRRRATPAYSVYRRMRPDGSRRPTGRMRYDAPSRSHVAPRHRLCSLTYEYTEKATSEITYLRVAEFVSKNR